VKVWRIPSHSGETIEEDESDHYLVCSLSHPSYVYAGLFLSEGVQSLIVSACFDSRIRIWKADARKTLVV
jgi:jouberin